MIHPQQCSLHLRDLIAVFLSRKACCFKNICSVLHICCYGIYLHRMNIRNSGGREPYTYILLKLSHYLCSACRTGDKSGSCKIGSCRIHSLLSQEYSYTNTGIGVIRYTVYFPVNKLYGIISGIFRIYLCKISARGHCHRQHLFKYLLFYHLNSPFRINPDFSLRVCFCTFGRSSQSIHPQVLPVSFLSDCYRNKGYEPPQGAYPAILWL